MTTPPKQRPQRSRPWEQSPGDASSFGRWLRRQREVRNIALREVAETTNISIRYLEALEDDRFEALPAPVFAKGFLREYARDVGLDPDEVVNHYLAARQDATVEEAERVATAQRASSPSPWRAWVWAAAIVLLLGAAAGGTYWWRSRQSSRPAPSPPPPPPAAVAIPQAAPATPTTPLRELPLRVTVDFTADSWVEVRIDGKPGFSELRVQGESLQLEAQQEVVLSLSNAAGAHVEVNGRPFPLAPDADGGVHEIRVGLDAAAPPSTAPGH
jgi:cytoskeletal protein RodZ